MREYMIGRTIQVREYDGLPGLPDSNLHSLTLITVTEG